MIPLRTRDGTLRIGTLVCDLDRTLTDARLRLVPSALAALQDARRRDARLVLATGRTLNEVRDRFPGLLDRFDAVALEGGGLVGRPGALRPLRGPAHELDGLRRWLELRSIPHRAGRTSISIPSSAVAVLRGFPRLRRIEVHRNRERADLTLRGVGKARAVKRLAAQGLAPGRRLAFGDAENDAGLFQACDYGVAVSNAEPRLRRLADEVTRFPGGRGVADFVRRRLLGDQPPMKAVPVRPTRGRVSAATSRRLSRSRVAARAGAGRSTTRRP